MWWLEAVTKRLFLHCIKLFDLNRLEPLASRFLLSPKSFGPWETGRPSLPTPCCGLPHPRRSPLPRGLESGANPRILELVSSLEWEPEASFFIFCSEQWQQLGKGPREGLFCPKSSLDSRNTDAIVDGTLVPECRHADWNLWSCDGERVRVEKGVCRSLSLRATG